MLILQNSVYSHHRLQEVLSYFHIWFYGLMPLLNYNPGHNILELYNVLVQVRFATSKMKIDTWYNKFGLRVASRLQNNFSRILGKKEILEKSRNWMKTETSAQSPSQKLIFGNSSQIIPKSSSVQSYWISLPCSKYFTA